MVDMQRNLEGAGVPGVQDKLEAMKIVAPPHPRYDELRLKAGKDADGTWWYFEQICGGDTDNGAWRKYRVCKTREAEKLNELDHTGVLLRKPDEGPAGSTLVYYQFA